MKDSFDYRSLFVPIPLGLKRLGFEFKEETVLQTPTTDPCPNYIYVKSVSKIELDVTIDAECGKGFLYISIVRPDSKHFSMSSYFEHQPKDKWKDIDESPVPFPEKAQKLLNLTIEALATELKDVIEGKRWIEESMYWGYLDR